MPPPPALPLASENLSPEEKLCAVLEGTRRFQTLKELAEYLGRTPFWLRDVRKKQDYKDLVQATVAEVARRLTESAADIESMFNEQIAPSVAALVEIRDNPFEKAADRIKSSLGLIDHAPAAPRAKEAAGGQVVLQIPVRQLDGIKKALEEEGEGELIELLRGKDFEAGEERGLEIEVQPAEAEFRVPVREIE